MIRHLLDNILPSLTKEDMDDMKLYYLFHNEKKEEIDSIVDNQFHNHPIIGEVLKNISREGFVKIRIATRQLQYNAFFKNDWEPYLETLASQGIMYARMGAEFYLWYDVLSIMRNAAILLLFKDLAIDRDKMAVILRGMNRYFDIAMNVISGTYLSEKKVIIEEQKTQQEKLNKELKRTMATLTEKNRDLEQFAYIASHDLQEPLRMVTSFLTQLENKYKGQLDDKAQQYIHFAVDGAVRMRRIILDLLEYSRVGRKEYEIESIDMNALVEEVIQLSQMLIKEQKAVINWESLPTIKGARTPLQQVLQNLISNALKYHQTAKVPLIDISAIETQTHWQFAVGDNGIGIEPQFFEKIFVIFQRLHSKEEYSGSGIGLAICRKIIEGHDGNIWVESVPGKGSIFYFTISKDL